MTSQSMMGVARGCLKVRRHCACGRGAGPKAGYDVMAAREHGRMVLCDVMEADGRGTASDYDV